MNRLVLIEWIDACSITTVGRWTDKAELDAIRPERCSSVGWVHREDDESIVLFSHDAGEQIGGDFCIPKCCVISIKEIAA